MFTTPCFVRVEDQEKRKELIDWLNGLGYRLEYIRPDDGVVILTSEDEIYVYGAGMLDVLRIDYTEAIDCRENVEMFKALAAMNDENDREQWFVVDEVFKFCPHEICPVQWIVGDNRKATTSEIIEHFKLSQK